MQTPIQHPLKTRISAEAQSWMGTPYHHAARIKLVAVDCAQLLIGVYCDELGVIPHPEVEEYPADWMLHRSEERFLAVLQTCAREVEVPEQGDVAIWMWGKCFAHAAIVIQWPIVVHADIRVGKVTLADATQGRFADRPVRFFRVAEEGAA